MAELPQRARATRRDFLRTAGLAAGVGSIVIPGRLGRAWAQGLKPISASHSVSTFVYGQHLVAAAKKLFEEEGLKTPDFVVPGAVPRSSRRWRRDRSCSPSATPTIRSRSPRRARMPS